jgi:cardiolipin synthase
MRFLLVPGVVYALLAERMEWAFIGFVIAGVSDGVDGFIARHFHQHSELGAYLDPVADKLLLASVFVVLGFMGELPLWLVVAAVARDGLIVIAVLLSSVMGNPVKVQPLMVSKANTAVQIVLVITVLAALTFDLEFGWFGDAMKYLSGLLTVASAAAYLVAWLRHMNGYGETDIQG